MIEDNVIDHWLSVAGCNDVSVRNNLISSHTGIVKFAGLELIGNNLVASDNVVDGGADLGWSLSGGGDNNLFLRNRISKSRSWGAQIQGDSLASHIFAKDSIFEQTRSYGVGIAPGYEDGFRTNQNVSGLALIGCRFQENAGRGIHLVSGRQRITIEDSWVVDNQEHAIWIDASASLVDLQVEGNTVTGNSFNTFPVSRGFTGNAAPTLALGPGGSTAVEVGQTVSFEAIFSDDQDAAPTRVLWDLGSGLPATTLTPTIVYEKPGDYLVTCVVWDSGGRPAWVERTVTVEKATVPISLTGLAQIYDGAPKSAGATTDPSGLAVRIDYLEGDAPTNAGSYPVTATIDDPIYRGSASGTLVIAKAAQTITFASPGNQLANAMVNLSATGGGSGNAVGFSVTGPGALDGSQLTFSGAGEVTVTANQTGNANYEAAPPVVRTFNVTKAAATVTLTNLSQTYNGTPRSAGATTDPAGKTVNFTYDGLPEAPTSAGEYTVVGTINDPIYQGSASGILEVAKVAQTITFASPGNQLATSTVNLSATGGASGNAVTFSVTGPGVLGGNQLTFTGAGEVTVTANQAGNANYEAATPVAHAVTVASALLSVTYTTGNEVPLTEAGFSAVGRTVNFTLNHAPARGAHLRVVTNTAPGFIEGTFGNLPNGAPVDLSFGGITYHFIAWYYGGDGNDLVLQWRETIVAAWGSNSGGQLGDDSETQKNAPVAVAQSGVLAGKTVVSLASGLDHSLALCSDGTLAAWGRADFGQLGNAGINVVSRVPVDVDRSGVLFGKTVVAIAAGDGHSLALCSDGTLAAWGRNDVGQLGDLSNDQRNVPVAVNADSGTSALFGKTVVAIAAGGSHSLALCSDGTVAAWGHNQQGQLGDLSNDQRNVPVAVNSDSGTSALFGKTVVAIAAGGSHSLALCSDGTVAAWGHNQHGQLGEHSHDQRNAPVVVSSTDGTSALYGRTVVALAAGGNHSLALCSDGTVTAWGRNASGQVGDNTTILRNAPAVVNATSGTSALVGKTIVAIGAGEEHSLALCSDGTLAAWGHNEQGQLGDHSNNQRNVPMAVAQSGVLGGNRFLGLAGSSASARHSLALFAAPPEIVVEQPESTGLTAGSATVDFGTTVPGVPISRTFVIRNSGLGEMNGVAISFAGANPGDFTVTSNPATPVSSGGTTTFTVRFAAGMVGAKTATLRIASNDADENPFDIALTGNSILGAHSRLGDALNLDLSSVTLAPGETLKVLGLPPGLVFNAGPPPTITGTVLGLAPTGGTTIQVLNGRTLVRSIPLEIVVDFYPPAGSYEVLLEDAGAPVGKLHVSITNPSTKVANPAYSATLDRLGEPRRTAKGSVVAGASQLTVRVIFPAFLTFPSVTYELILTHGSDTITGATFPASAVTARGFRLARPVRVPGGNPALTLSLPPATPGDRVTTPGGTGFATGTVTSKALVNLAGQLGDAQGFTTGLNLSQTNQAVVWLTPYKNKTSYLGGIIDIGDHGSANRAASPDSANPSLQWMRQPDATATSYPAGFGPLSLGATPSRWVKVARVDAMADVLGMGPLRELDVSFTAPTSDVMPTRLSLRDNFTLLRFAPDDAVPFTAKTVGSNGSFAGNLTLPAPAAKSAIGGVLLQDNAFGTLIGRGIVKIPIAGGVKGSFQTAGIEFTKAASILGQHWSIGTAYTDDVSRYLLAPEETLKVIGLPAGLVFTAGPPPMITGTLKANVGANGITIQVFNGRTLLRSYAYTLDTIPYRWADRYELLIEASGLPAGRIGLTITGPSALSSDAAFSATLDRPGETRRSIKGSFNDSGVAAQTVRLAFPAFNTFPPVTYDVALIDTSSLVSATTVPATTVTGRGFRLARAARIPVGNPLLTISFPPTSPGDRVTTPGGIGYASGRVTAAGLVPLSGMLGDGQAFKATLSLSSTHQAIVWLTPHKNKASYLGGIIDLGDLGAADRGAPTLFATTGLKWHRLADATEPSYPGGFGPLDLNARTSRWFRPANAEALAASLGLDFRVIHPTYIAPTTDILPGRLSLRDNFTLLRLLPTNAVPFTGTALGTNGTFSGNLTLPVPAARSAVSGVFLQEESFGQLIGQGVVKIPVVGPVKGSFQTMGVELRN